MIVGGYVAAIATSAFADNRVSASKKGSVIFFSKIELKWDAATGALKQDTFLTIVNDFPADVFVQWYFVNGDAPTDAVFAQNPPVLVERAHSGWNWVDCTTFLSHDESTYMSAATGNPLGCQSFNILDPARTPFLGTDPRTFPGRLDPDAPAGNRVLRGYALAFAVDNQGHEVSWNHLSGNVDIVNYVERSAWEYNGYAFQCVAQPTPGLPCGADNTLNLDGLEYDFAFDKLLLDFFAVDSFALSPTIISTVDPDRVSNVLLNTDLTLYPVSVDLRQDNDGPVTTKAKFDIWNQNEDGFSGTTRCITCWDQTLLSKYGSPNNFLIGSLHTDKGKARVDGVASNVCDPPGSCCNLSTDPDCFPSADHPQIDLECSKGAALLGVADKILFFSGPGALRRQSEAGMTLVGQGTQSASIKRDVILPPEPLMTGAEDQLVPVQVEVETSTTTPGTVSRGQRQVKD